MKDQACYSCHSIDPNRELMALARGFSGNLTRIWSESMRNAGNKTKSSSNKRKERGFISSPAGTAEH